MDSLVHNGYYRLEISADDFAASGVVRISEGDISGDDALHHDSGRVRDGASPLHSYLNIQSHEAVGGTQEAHLRGEYMLDGFRQSSYTDFEMSGSKAGNGKAIRIRATWHAAVADF
ncbi:MAG: hypothetical protein V4488_09945 [Pseudomonadota bacterium]